MDKKVAMESKTEGTIWKSITICIRNWCQKWPYILFEAIYRENKRWGVKLNVFLPVSDDTPLLLGLVGKGGARAVFGLNAGPSTLGGICNLVLDNVLTLQLEPQVWSLTPSGSFLDHCKKVCLLQTNNQSLIALLARPWNPSLVETLPNNQRIQLRQHHSRNPLSHHIRTSRVKRSAFCAHYEMELFPSEFCCQTLVHCMTCNPKADVFFTKDHFT